MSGEDINEYMALKPSCYRMYSASALAANTVIRSAVAAGFPLFTNQLFTNVRTNSRTIICVADRVIFSIQQLGVGWGSTIFGCIGILLLPSPFLFYKYGARIRAKSKFAPCIVSYLSVVLRSLLTTGQLVSTGFKSREGPCSRGSPGETGRITAS